MKKQFKKGMQKLKGNSKKAIRKLPEPMRKKADDQFGLFIHKYIATLFIFDEDIQEAYWDMEEAIENGDKQEALQYSAEIKSIITIKTNPDSAYYSRKMDKRMKKVTKKIKEQGDKLESLTEDMGARKLYNLVSEGVGKDPEDPEDLAEELDLENLEEEIDLETEVREDDRK